MPAQQRARSDQARAARGVCQVASRRRQQATIRGAKVRPRHLAAQDLELVTKDEQLDVLDVETAATANEGSQQRPRTRATETRRPRPRSSQPAREGRDTSIGTLQASATSRVGHGAVAVAYIWRNGRKERIPLILPVWAIIARCGAFAASVGQSGLTENRGVPGSSPGLAFGDGLRTGGIPAPVLLVASVDRRLSAAPRLCVVGQRSSAARSRSLRAHRPLRSSMSATLAR